MWYSAQTSDETSQFWIMGSAPSISLIPSTNVLRCAPEWNPDGLTTWNPGGLPPKHFDHKTIDPKTKSRNKRHCFWVTSLQKSSEISGQQSLKHCAAKAIAIGQRWDNTSKLRILSLLDIYVAPCVQIGVTVSTQKTMIGSAIKSRLFGLSFLRDDR